ncbi:MAG: uncharacterized protein JWN94_1152 [Betaproteobacteria bacterium]|nr:uncharacterized protein [Betaproteobacteria bacterium]
MKRLFAIASALLVLAISAGCAYTPYGPAQMGWTTLFDGTDLNNFTRLGDGNWRLQDGYAQADLAGAGSSFLVTKKSYKDFQLRAEFWVDPSANSGIFIRCTNPKEVGTKTAYEVNIYDTRPDPSYGTGAIVDVAKVDPMPRAGNQWNTMEIIAQGPRMTVIFNGKVTVDGVQDTKFGAGPIALQYGGGVVKFRKVEIKPL